MENGSIMSLKYMNNINNFRHNYQKNNSKIYIYFSRLKLVLL